MSDDDDYGFTYSDEDEFNEDEVDIENAYYNAKGAPRDDSTDERARPLANANASTARRNDPTDAR